MKVSIEKIKIKKQAKKLLDGRTWFMFLCNFLFLCIISIIGTGVYFIPNPLEKILTNFVYGNMKSIDCIYFEINMEWVCWGIYMFFRTLIFVALTYPFYVCLATIPLSIVRNQKITIKTIFLPIHKSRYFLEYAVAGLERFIITLLWTFLAIIPGFFSHYKFSFTRFLFVDDNEKTAGETLAESKELTIENREKLFSLDMSFLGWWIISLVTCGLGFIFAISYHEIAYALYYTEIKKTIKDRTIINKITEENLTEQKDKTDKNSEGNSKETNFETTDNKN